MTDRYTELVKAAYEAQQAREGERYQALTSDLAKIDNDLRVTASLREATVLSLEAMDDAVEAAKEALDAYFAGREEDDHPLTRDHMCEHDEDELGPKASYSVPGEPSWGDMEPIESDDEPFIEEASARGGGGLNDIPN